jgi:hypothetical protein
MSSGITMTHRYPRTAQIIARLMPVLPLVASTTVDPGTSSPDSSAARIIESAGRSFTEPATLLDSSFPQTSAPLSPVMRASLTKGVWPIRSNAPS